jgi:hypothetical protein
MVKTQEIFSFARKPEDISENEGIDPRHNCKHHACTLTHTVTHVPWQHAGEDDVILIFDKMPPHNTSISCTGTMFLAPCQIMIAYFSTKLLITYQYYLMSQRRHASCDPEQTETMRFTLGSLDWQFGITGSPLTQPGFKKTIILRNSYSLHRPLNNDTPYESTESVLSVSLMLSIWNSE